MKQELDRNGFLKKKENNLYKLAFTLLLLSGFVAAPIYAIAHAFDNNVVEIAAALSSLTLTAGGMATACAADRTMVK